MTFAATSQSRMLARACLALAVFACADPAAAQTKAPDAVAVDTRFGFLTSQQNQFAVMKLTKDSFGRPCLSVSGEARPLINNLFSHIVIAQNNCPFSLKISTCYLGSGDCVSSPVPPRARKELLLGSFPRAKDFRFEFREMG